MDDADLIRAYERAQRRRGHQPTSIAVRTFLLRRYSRWHDGQGILTSTSADVEAFLDRSPLVSKTRYNYLAHLHGFFEFCIRAGHTDADPTVAIERPRLPKRLPRPIATADLEMALQMAPPRERAVLALAAYQGMRCIEIARLTREDVLDTEEPAVLVVFGKGSKERIVPLHPESWRALLLLPMPKAGPVFKMTDGHQAQAWNISHIGNRYLDHVGSDATVHQLRHWFGTHLYRTSGHDLLLVAALMGHESPTTTTIYARYDQKRAPDAVRALTTKRDQ